MTVAGTESIESPEDTIDDERDDFERWTLEISSKDLARWVFLAYLVVAIPVLLIMGSSRWFLGDEWTFLTTKSATNLHDLFQPHNQHWSTIPLISYKLLYAIFGVREYWPYQLLVILAHLAIAGLLRVIMRRCGVGPWLATVAAGVYVLFGPGVDDILWAFQIGFTLSVVFGLGQMLMADHDGSLDRRDWYGLGLGGLALLTSGQAPAIILATGLAVWWRRGWRQAAFHTVPLGIIYAIWYVWAKAGPQYLSDLQGRSLPAMTAHDLIHFMWTAALGLFAGLGHFLVLDWAYVALLGVGVAVAWTSTHGRERSRRLAMPGALMIGAAVGMVAAAPTRWWLSPEAARASRYVAVTVAMALPLFAVAGDALIRKWRYTAPLVLILFLLPIPWDIPQLNPTGITGPAYYRALRTWVATVPTLPALAHVPAWVEPDISIIGTPDLTAGWLRQASRQGKLPPPGKLDPYAASLVPIQFGVALRPGTAPPGLTCAVHTAPLAIDPHLGDVWALKSDLRVSLRSGDKASGIPDPFSPDRRASVVQITLPNLHLLVTPALGAKSFRLCT